jgi:hypothetical protein
MVKDDLLQQLRCSIGKTKVIALSAVLEAQQFALRDLIDLTFFEDDTIAFRAAWILENFLLKKPEAYLCELDYLLSRVKEVTYPSCQRHYAKILMHLTAHNAHAAIRQKMDQTDLEPIVEQCFDWLIDPKTKVAVKNFSAITLSNLKERYPWIEEELKNQMEFLMRNGSAGIQVRGKKILGKNK